MTTLTFPKGGVDSTVSEVFEELGIDEEWLEDINIVGGAKCLMYRGDLHIDGNLSLDYSDYGSDDRFNESETCEERFAIAVLGDLTVIGGIENLCTDTGIRLLISGNLKAKHLFTGGMSAVIKGNVDIESFVIGYIPGGELLAGGELRAKAFINHNFSGWNGADPTNVYSRDGKDLVESLLPELVDDDYQNMDKVREYVRADKPIFK